LAGSGNKELQMTVEKIQPLIIGRGMAGQALRHALSMFPDDIAPASWLERGAPVPEPEDPDRALLVVAGPHALHTPRLLEAAERGYRYAICEKPAAVDLEQMAQLDDLPVATWICHGYRMMWGPQELRQAVGGGRFGKIISIEGRYWQSSATRKPTGVSWKDNPEIGGRFDVLLDLATHWTDLVTFVSGCPARGATVRRWFINAASPHRDTHVHLTIEHGEFPSLGSISKTVHGAGNALEISILGEDASATWAFERPDVIVWGRKGEQSTQVRTAADPPTRLAPFHGLGWMEGYGRLVGEVIAHMRGGEVAEAPTLEEHLAVLRCLIKAAGRE
jgi:predicted dehydrogenase